MGIVLGILGGGQLARMTAQAAQRLGIEVAVLDASHAPPAGQVTSRVFQGKPEDRDLFRRFADSCTCVTLENEFIDPHHLEFLEERGLPVFASSKTVALIQDKLIQKETVRGAGIATPDFRALHSLDDAADFGNHFGYPFVMKARKHSYDGYGNRTVQSPADLTQALSDLNFPVRGVYAEAWAGFDRELAVIAVRGRGGQTAVYPVVETVQENHICKIVRAPGVLDPTVEAAARKMALRVVEAVDGVGVFGVEMFLCGSQILFNEIAPRPHNSGHYTIDACATSQFENHARAALGWSLGDTSLLFPAAVMVNILGRRDAPVSLESLSRLDTRGGHVHVYGKADSRKGRKMGHVTVTGQNAAEAERIALAIDEAIEL